MERQQSGLGPELQPESEAQLEAQPEERPESEPTQPNLDNIQEVAAEEPAIERLPEAHVPPALSAPPFDISSSLTFFCLVLALLVMFTLALALQVYFMHSTTYYDGLVLRAVDAGMSYSAETTRSSHDDATRETMSWRINPRLGAKVSVPPTKRPYVYWNTRRRSVLKEEEFLEKHPFRSEAKTTNPAQRFHSFYLLPARDYLGERKSVCMFHANGAGRLRNGARYTAWTFPYHVCTHIVYCCTAISNDLNMMAKRYDTDLQGSSLSAFAALKHKNPHLRVLVGVGGEEKDRVGFSKIADSISARQQFTVNAVEWMRQKRFDGMIFYWKYPFLDQRAKLVDLMRSLRDTLRDVNLTIGIVIPLDELLRDRFDVEELSHSMDDYTVLIDPVDNHNPSYDATFVPFRDATVRTYAGLFLSTLRKVNGKLQDGRYRLCYLLPIHGVTFTLEEPAQTEINSPTLGPGEPGVSTDRPGFLSYDEVCVEPWEDSRRVNYGIVSTRGNQWVVYQNRTSLRELITALGLVTRSAKCLGVWDPSWDDFSGFCGEGSYPLTRAVFAKVVGHRITVGPEQASYGGHQGSRHLRDA